MTLEDDALIQILEHGESYRVERKRDLTGGAAASIREAVCAFANDLPDSREPGVVLVGVTDDGAPTGLAITDELLQKLADIKTDGNIVPPPSMFVEKRRLKGADIAVIFVLPSDSPPVRYKGTIQVRIGPRRGTATAQDERILNEKRRARDIPFDIHPVPGTGFSGINTRLFEEEYLRLAFSSDVLEANERTLAERLAATKMIASVDDPTVTILGLLVLGTRPRDFIPGSYIQFLRISGTALEDAIADAEEIDGTISEILRRLDDKLKAHLFTSVDIVGSDRERRASAYPLAALQQIARNAIMHRTYEATNAPVRISWFDDRIECLSPGGAFGIVTRQNFGQPGVTDYRNPNLAEAMRVLGYVQRFGVGISTARRLLKDAGHPPPEFTVEDGFVNVVIRTSKQ